jgi:uncharacterized protein
VNAVTRRGTALVTGASSGIGRELVRCFAADGYDLALVGRDEAGLNRIGAEHSAAHGVVARVFAADLGRPGAAGDLIARLDREGMTIDHLVNSAGFGDASPFARSDPAKTYEMMQLNMITLTELTRALLPGMLARRRGRILNIASTAAFQPGPGMAVYYATKAYVLSFSEAIAHEVRGSGVTVTTLCPGTTRTGFQARTGNQETRLLHGPIPVMDSETVARDGYRAMMRGRGVVVPGFMNKITVNTPRFFPRAFVTRVVAWFNGQR